MSMFWHCPICWDGEESCKCTQADFDEFYKRINKQKQEDREIERRNFHDLLDLSFDRYEKLSIFDHEGYASYLAKEVLKGLTRGEWERIKIQLDKFYHCKPKS